MAIPELREVYLDVLRQCVTLAAEPAADDTRGWLEREVDRQASQVTVALVDDPVYPWTFNDFLDAVPELVEFAQLRASFVSCEVTQMAASPDEPSSCAIVKSLAKSKAR